jgi:predicted TIM-barrel fold metal-dependent hydrolase
MLLEQCRLAQNLRDWDIIDLHGHMGRVQFPTVDGTAGSIVSEMDRIGIVAIVLSHMQAMQGRVEFGNDELYAAMREFSGRIFGYTSIWPTSAEAVRNETSRRLAQGFVGIKLHNANGFGYDHPHYVPAWEIAQAHHLPVLVHSWGQEAEFSQIRTLAARYPQANILMAHSGSLHPEEYGRIGREVPNVYLDLAFSRTGMGLIEQLVSLAGADKVTWGSDCCFFSMTQQIGKMAGAKISEQDKRKILSTNPHRLLAARKV